MDLSLLQFYTDNQLLYKTAFIVKMLIGLGYFSWHWIPMGMGLEHGNQRTNGPVNANLRFGICDLS